MKIANIVTMKDGGKKVEVHLTKEDTQNLLQYAFNDLMEKGAISVVKEKDAFLMKLTVGGNA